MPVRPLYRRGHAEQAARAGIDHGLECWNEFIALERGAQFCDGGPFDGASRARRVRRDGLREASKLLRALLVQWIMEQY